METLNDLGRPPQYRPRKAWLAALLSFLFPGLGQVYNGCPWRGVGWFVGITLLLPVLAGVSRLPVTFSGGMLLFGVATLLRIGAIVDAALGARARREYLPGRNGGTPAVLLAGLAMLALSWVVEPKVMTGVESFAIPTEASAPTLRGGDRVMSDRWAYRGSDPDYGHLIVFEDAKTGTMLFRVIGLPGDTISYLDNMLTINGRVQPRRVVGELTTMVMPVTEFRETLPNGFTHGGYVFRHQPKNRLPEAEQREIVVPRGEYYVMGDFRDNAQDSRFIGTVAREQITGRLRYSWWGESSDRIGIDFTR